MKDLGISPQWAALTLVQDGKSLRQLHTHFDRARDRGLPPHHAINSALGKLAEEPKRTEGETDVAGL